MPRASYRTTSPPKGVPGLGQTFCQRCRGASSEIDGALCAVRKFVQCSVLVSPFQHATHGSIHRFLQKQTQHRVWRWTGRPRPLASLDRGLSMSNLRERRKSRKDFQYTKLYTLEATRRPRTTQAPAEARRARLAKANGAEAWSGTSRTGSEGNRGWARPAPAEPPSRALPQWP
jgi:hypothetical protein